MDEGNKWKEHGRNRCGGLENMEERVEDYIKEKEEENQESEDKEGGEKSNIG